MSFLKRFGYAFGSLLVLLFACQDTFEFSTDSNDKLAFTTDTLRFDTVFTELGSATRSFKIKNTTDKLLKISRISLANRTSAIFNLNIDGIAGRSFKDVEILPNDSLYVFAEVTINPNAPLSISPFVISEDLVFETNGNTQKVVLEAWGQNANYIPSRFSKGGFALISGGNPNAVVNFDDKKPYVIYGGLLLDSCIVRIAAGTNFYFHGGLGVLPDGDIYRDGIFIVQKNAKLEANGTLEKPITFQSDRLEKEFEKEPDQWFGIINSSERAGNVMTHTTIRNSRVGVSVDSAANLTLRNCKIFNTGGSALVASRARVTAENCLFYNAGGNAVQISYGGDYEFNYCTLSGIGSKEAALSLDNFRCVKRNELGQCEQARIFRLNFSATNCAIYGSKDDEIILFDATKDVTTDFNYIFKNNIVRVKDLLKPDEYPDFLQKCSNCVQAESASRVFKRPSDGNFRPDSLSILLKKALPIPNISTDIDNKMRNAQTPDIGCYEAQMK